MFSAIGLNVCLGTIEMSLAAFADIRAGELFEINWKPEQPVVVFFGEKPIAKARLVSDEKTVYAEIVSLLD